MEHAAPCHGCAALLSDPSEPLCRPNWFTRSASPSRFSPCTYAYGPGLPGTKRSCAIGRDMTRLLHE
eukprot:3141231-Heterocapsa_arctica.AAC.1